MPEIAQNGHVISVKWPNKFSWKVYVDSKCEQAKT